MVAVIGRGLTFEGGKEMTLGQLVDYCIAWNDAHEIEENGTNKTVKKRKATQADWDSLLG